MKQMRPSICAAFFLAVATGLWCQQPDPPGQVRTGKAVNEAYLFAHMVQGDYDGCITPSVWTASIGKPEIPAL